MTGDIIERRVRRTIAATLAGCGLATGLMHVQSLALASGVPRWGAWTAAVTIELIVIYGTLEARSRHTRRASVWPALAVILVGFLLSMACQVAQARPTVWGWTFAAWPVLAFLMVGKFEVASLDAGIPAGEIVDQEDIDLDMDTTIRHRSAQVDTCPPVHLPDEPVIADLRPAGQVDIPLHLVSTAGEDGAARGFRLSPADRAAIETGERTQRDVATAYGVAVKTVQRALRRPAVGE